MWHNLGKTLWPGQFEQRTDGTRRTTPNAEMA